MATASSAVIPESITAYSFMLIDENGYLQYTTPVGNLDSVLTSLIEDDFSASAVSTGSRFQSGDINSGDWVKRSTDGPAWTVSGEQLTNPATTTNDDKGAFLMTEVNVHRPELHRHQGFLRLHGRSRFHPLFSLGPIHRGHHHEWESFQNHPNRRRLLRERSKRLQSRISDRHSTSGTEPSLQAVLLMHSSRLPETPPEPSTKLMTSPAIPGSAASLMVSHLLAVFAADTAAAGDGAITIDNVNISAVAPQPPTTGLLEKPTISVTTVDSVDYLTVSFTPEAGSTMTYTVEVSTDLDLWEDGVKDVDFFDLPGSPVDNGDGTMTIHLRYKDGIDDQTRFFIRLRADQN